VTYARSNSGHLQNSFIFVPTDAYNLYTYLRVGGNLYYLIRKLGKELEAPTVPRGLPHRAGQAAARSLCPASTRQPPPIFTSCCRRTRWPSADVRGRNHSNFRIPYAGMCTTLVAGFRARSAVVVQFAANSCYGPQCLVSAGSASCNIRGW